MTPIGHLTAIDCEAEIEGGAGSASYHSTGNRTSLFSSVSWPPYSQCSNASAYSIARPRSSPYRSTSSSRNRSAIFANDGHLSSASHSRRASSPSGTSSNLPTLYGSHSYIWDSCL